MKGVHFASGHKRNTFEGELTSLNGLESRIALCFITQTFMDQKPLKS